MPNRLKLLPFDCFPVFMNTLDHFAKAPGDQHKANHVCDEHEKLEGSYPVPWPQVPWRVLLLVQ